ncbi:MAG: hypothetical protein GW778_01120 [Alphaproteobacteria bacterium]|nr:hypothetical protein [Alphaproteobacteria bacterium]
MKQVFIFLCVMLVCGSYIASASAQDFFNSVPDIPLMDGLVEIEDQALSFDKPEGRIVIGAASIGADIDDSQLLSYYQRALPQFGWRAVSTSSYVRNDETLDISITEREASAGSDRIMEIIITP